MVFSLRQDSVEKRLAHNKHGDIARSLFLQQEDIYASEAMGM